jgi:hypothetical protein
MSNMTEQKRLSINFRINCIVTLLLQKNNIIFKNKKCAGFYQTYIWFLIIKNADIFRLIG